MTKNKIFADIAKRRLGIKTLRTRNSDSLDFHDVAVWQIKDALEEAFQAGKDSLKGVPINPPPQKRCGGGGKCGGCGCAGCR